MKSPSRPRAARRAAFTLIELLTVIAIIGILAAIMIPTVGKVRGMANDAQCKTSLRQWGMAMQLYIDDNKGRLPGPCPVYIERQLDPVNPDDTGNRHLFRYLAPYVSLKNHDSGIVPDAYICSAWVRATPNAKRGEVYMLRRPEDSDFFPYGWNTSSPWLYATVIADERWRETVAMIDMDDELPTSDHLTKAPPRPVHGGHRNVLHWDWHVSPRKVTGKKGES
ncbi:hypothetical protein OPIT5_12030 [Opitutaceae bacterium TAV5]|nr:hypothetical protein OPIT5_12030 [Opitutaceae bacterium TAV5]